MSAITKELNKNDVLNWNFNNAGYHFITLTTLDGEHYFGEVRKEIMGLSVQGCLACYCWKWIPHYFGGVKADQLIVMPNHIHGILKTGDQAQVHLKSSIDSIIRFYKRSVMRCCHFEGIMVMWQSGYQDEIIQDQHSLQKIREFIHNDPLQWHPEWSNIW